jgi:uncharacterized membrane-anchored protein
MIPRVRITFLGGAEFPQRVKMSGFPEMGKRRKRMFHKIKRLGASWGISSTAMVVGALFLLLGLGALVHAKEQKGEDPARPSIGWQRGPTTASLGGIGEIKVPEGYVFADTEDTKKLMEMMQNPISGQEIGLLAPKSLDWFVLFEFSSIGYVKDDEKDELDATAILESITEGNEQSNKVRGKKGWAELSILGWEQAPHYDATTHNLEWAIRVQNEKNNNLIINYQTRVLGRRGVMKVNLVTDPASLPETLPTFKGLLTDYAFQPGQSYAEFRAGDKIAKYGLVGLITGGAAAAAMKVGFFGFIKKFFKVILLGVVAAVGACWKFLKRFISGEDPR